MSTNIIFVEHTRKECLCSTAKGNLCKNRARDGSKYCHVHSNMVEYDPEFLGERMELWVKKLKPKPKKITQLPTIFNKAINNVQKAVISDNNGQYIKAYILYMKSIKMFKTGLKYETNRESRAIITDRVREYQKRALKIREM